MPLLPPDFGRARRARRDATRLAHIVVLLLLATAPAGADAFTIGAGKTCDSNTLFGGLFLAALNGPGSDDLRIANDQTYTGIDEYIGLHNVRLIGGYADCDAATPTGTTTLDGSGDDSAVVIESDGTTGTRYTHHFENLVITGGETGGLSIDGNIDFSLVNVEIASNTGSGLTVLGPGPIGTVDAGSSIHHNVGATNGGGINCTSANLTLHGDVEHNEASSTGGGIYSTCTLTISVTTDQIDIAYNDAPIGAGMRLLVSGTQTFAGNGVGPIDIHHNGDEFGTAGAMSLSYTSGSSTLVLQNSWIRDNFAFEIGGVDLYDGRFVMERTLAGNACHTPHRCSWMARNEALNTSDSSLIYHGGAFRAVLGQIELHGTVLEENVGLFGSLAWLETSSSLTLENSTVSGHRGEALVFFDSNNTLTVRHASIAGNRTFDGSGESWVVDPDFSGEVEIVSSIVTDPIRTVTPTTETYDCLLHGATTGPGFSATRSFAGDADFASVGSGDLSLGPASEAYDRCDGTNVAGITDDLELAARPVDDPSEPGAHGTYDLGAYESLSPRYIFSDGVESGNTTAWSSTVG